MSALIPIHPEATASPLTVRWVIPPGIIHGSGVVHPWPAPLAEIEAIAAIEVTPTAVLMTLSEGHSWQVEGGRIRAALQQALTTGTPWQLEHHDPEAVLIEAVNEMIAGPTGEFIRSHGGSIALVKVNGTDVELELGGACRHCPALNFTLQARVDRNLRNVAPQLGELRVNGRRVRTQR